MSKYSSFQAVSENYLSSITFKNRFMDNFIELLYLLESLAIWIRNTDTDQR